MSRLGHSERVSGTGGNVFDGVVGWLIDWWHFWYHLVCLGNRWEVDLKGVSSDRESTERGGVTYPDWLGNPFDWRDPESCLSSL